MWQRNMEGETGGNMISVVGGSGPFSEMLLVNQFHPKLQEGYHQTQTW